MVKPVARPTLLSRPIGTGPWLAVLLSAAHQFPIAFAEPEVPALTVVLLHQAAPSRCTRLPQQCSQHIHAIEAVLFGQWHTGQ